MSSSAIARFEFDSALTPVSKAPRTISTRSGSGSAIRSRLSVSSLQTALARTAGASLSGRAPLVLDYLIEGGVPRGN